MEPPHRVAHNNDARRVLLSATSNEIVPDRFVCMFTVNMEKINGSVAELTGGFVEAGTKQMEYGPTNSRCCEVGTGAAQS